MHWSSRLRIRSGKYYYHRRIPLPLTRRLGKSHISISLRTSDPKIAARMRDLEDLKHDALFEKLIAEPQAGAGLEITTPEIIRQVQEYVARMDRAATEREIASASSADDVAESRQDAEIARQLLVAEGGESHGQQWAWTETAKILDHSPTALDPEFTLGAFLEITRRGLLELQDRKLLRLNGDFSRPFVNGMFSSETTHRSDDRKVPECLAKFRHPLTNSDFERVPTQPHHVRTARPWSI